ncbi:ABC-F family ATP-binding cassette domain-containing protein [Salibacteraceae bacterium]|jgi:ATP-binding cassette subfamily F protein uup|nr:ABC-F family ATP-binding cassette domain-containing protein [Bacteroidota bacterium]MDA9968051.1 ABC-F family ATP-binding cassette domain-containing protein [Salibacteraceae bacterium]MDB9725439.1 ABC-F family ATP-binding cassette domain-containing protein [Salibacteraceae bacterium]
MNYLSIESISKRFADREILSDLTFGMAAGDKVALVAQNGTGKSTLMKIIAGLEEPDSGRVVFRKGIKVRYLMQDPKINPDLTIWDSVFETDNPILLAISEYERCLEVGETGEAFQSAMDTLEELKGWDQEVKVKSILSELNIDQLDAKVGSLSGGQLKRLALAKVLIDEPDFLMLDEPTNHLDLEMIEWLEKFLKTENITLLMVTHDRYFLENVCNTILEMDDFGLYTYKGNYSFFLERREERKASDQATIEKAKNLFRTEVEWMRRQPKARTTKSKARIDSFYDLKQVAKQRIENKQVELEINMERMGSKILEFHNVGKGFKDKQLFEGFSYKFKRAEKVGIIGPNGTGKSTLLNIITEKIQPDSGKVVIGETIKIGYFNQEGMKFKPNERVFEVVKKVAEFIPLAKGKKLSASQLLERFLFPKNMHYNMIEKLSGGEKRRLHLLTVLMKNPNFLILDEPTNDLDIMTLNILEDFLLDFPGCVIIVSHDRYFMDKLVDHLFVLEKDKLSIKDYPGNYSQWRDWKKAGGDKVEEIAQKKEVEKKAKPKNVTSDKPQKMSFNEKREFGILEIDIEKLEKRRDEINKQFESGIEDSDKVMKLSDELGEIIEDLETKSDRWLELSEKEA